MTTAIEKPPIVTEERRTAAGYVTRIAMAVALALVAIVVLLLILSYYSRGIVWRITYEEFVSLPEREDLNCLFKALAAYESKYGATPPSRGTDAIRQHIAMARFDYNDALAKSISAQDLNVEDLDERETLVLWLGGVSTKGDNSKLTGRYSLYPFDEDNLVDDDGDGWWEHKVFRRDRVFILTPDGPAIRDNATGLVITEKFFDAGGDVIIRE